MKAVFFKTILFWFPFDFDAEDIDFLLEMSPKARLLFMLAPGVVANDDVECLAEDAVLMVFSLDTTGLNETDDVEEDGNAVERGANMMW